jgi:hypothetical protein
MWMNSHQFDVEAEQKKFGAILEEVIKTREKEERKKEADAEVAEWLANWEAEQEELERRAEQSEHQLGELLQHLANEDRLLVNRFEDYQETTVKATATNAEHSFRGCLVGQDFAMGWSEEYCKATKVLEDGYIEIQLMVDIDTWFPRDGEFKDIRLRSVCNLEDFKTYSIRIKRECVVDHF